jgi:hypothetical protein
MLTQTLVKLELVQPQKFCYIMWLRAASCVRAVFELPRFLRGTTGHHLCREPPVWAQLENAGNPTVIIIIMLPIKP